MSYDSIAAAVINQNIDLAHQNIDLAHQNIDLASENAELRDTLNARDTVNGQLWSVIEAREKENAELRDTLAGKNRIIADLIYLMLYGA
jgi:septal ring factor EnvC (AmiA/AmiB activator)